MTKIQIVGVFLVSPALDRVLVSRTDELVEVPWCRINPRENPFEVAQKLTQRIGISIKQEDLVKQEPVVIENAAFYVVMGGSKPSNNSLSYLPWRILESECSESLYPFVEQIKQDLL
jgi:hypothetical protein